MAGPINNPESWKTGKFDPDTGEPVDLLRVFVDALQGTFVPSGLSKEIKISNLVVNSTADKLPASPLLDRNSMIIYNKSNQTIFIGNSDVDTNGVKEGWEIDANSFYAFDIRDTIEIYAIAATDGANVKIMELA